MSKPREIINLLLTISYTYMYHFREEEGGRGNFIARELNFWVGRMRMFKTSRAIAKTRYFYIGRRAN